MVPKLKLPEFSGKPLEENPLRSTAGMKAALALLCLALIAVPGAFASDASDADDFFRVRDQNGETHALWWRIQCDTRRISMSRCAASNG